MGTVFGQSSVSSDVLLQKTFWVSWILHSTIRVNQNFVKRSSTKQKWLTSCLDPIFVYVEIHTFILIDLPLIRLQTESRFVCIVYEGNRIHDMIRDLYIFTFTVPATGVSLVLRRGPETELMDVKDVLFRTLYFPWSGSTLIQTV